MENQNDNKLGTQIDEFGDLYDKFIQFIECEEQVESYFGELSNFLQEKQIMTNKDDLKILLHIINYIGNYHIRKNKLKEKLGQFFDKFKNDINQLFTNSELFDIYDKNALILLILIDRKMMKFDNDIVSILELEENKHFYLFFSKEIKEFYSTNERKKKLINDEINKVDSTILNDDKFEEKRREGENDSELCKIIRSDSVSEFSKYLSANNISLNTPIKYSIFETNAYLIRNTKDSNTNNPTLLQYAAFCGSIQIFNHIAEKTEIQSSIWPYAVHSSTDQIVTFVSKTIPLESSNYAKILKESIKCHHNDTASFIMEQPIKGSDEDYSQYGLHYYNFSYFPEEINGIETFNLLCSYDYLKFVKLLLDNKVIDINNIIISTKIL